MAPPVISVVATIYLYFPKKVLSLEPPGWVILWEVWNPSDQDVALKCFDVVNGQTGPCCSSLLNLEPVRRVHGLFVYHEVAEIPLAYVDWILVQARNHNPQFGWATGFQSTWMSLVLRFLKQSAEGTTKHGAYCEKQSANKSISFLNQNFPK